MMLFSSLVTGFISSSYSTQCKKESRLTTVLLLSLLSLTTCNAVAEDAVDEGHYRPDLLEYIVIPSELVPVDEAQQNMLVQSLTTEPAEQEEQKQEYLGRNVLQQLDIKYDITAETTGLMGEQLDLSSGSVSFLQTDIDIPGNSALPVRLSRTWGGPDRWYSANRFFANWNLDIAYVSTTIASANDVYFTGSWAEDKACSGRLNPQSSLTKGGAVLQVNDYWNGDSVYIPGQGSTTLLTSSEASRVTKNNWKVSCFVSDKGYEGFKVTTPDGLTYTFDQLRMVRGQDLFKSGPVEGVVVPGPITGPDPGQGGGQISFARYHTFMLISRVDDRFGNWVNYRYTDNNLTRIEASDGRAIDLEYVNNRVASATAHDKTWSYGYDGNALTTVSRPDGKSWQFDASQAAFFDQAPDSEGRCMNIDERFRPHHLISITHPTGAVGEFTVKAVRHGRTEVPKLQVGPVDDNNYRYAFAIDRCYNTIALTTKTLSGAGLENMVWRYSYSENEGAFIDEDKDGIIVIGGNLPEGMLAGDLKYTHVKAPDNSVTVHYFNRRFDWQEGSEMFSDQFDTNGTTLLRRTQKAYIKGNNFGFAEQQFSNEELSSHAVLNSRQQILEHENTYTTEYSAFNAYSTPTLTKESNSLSSDSRWQQTVYYHDTVNWLLNQPAKLQYSTDSSNWITTQETSYYAHDHSYKSLPHQKRMYGNLIGTFNSYHSDGNLKQHSYNLNNHWVQFDNYKRGKPQLIKLPERYTSACSDPATCFITASQVVNDDGTVAQVTDLNGNSTSYQYDAMRRLTGIIPDDTVWSQTTISYTTSEEYFIQSISRGDYRKTIKLDGLLRPVLTKEWDFDNEAATSRYTVQRFNAYNKPVFTSYASASSTESQGTAFEYDGLQRLKRQYSTVDNKGMDYEYLADNQIRTTDARGNSTTTTYRAFGSPDQKLPTKIEQPESVTTDIGYNLFDNITTVTQGGITESRIYNAQQQLCRLVRPDVGHTAYKYNALGQPVWIAQGASGSATSCDESAVTAAQKVSYSYDNLGEQHTINYPDSTPDKTYTYDNQGNLKALAAGSAVWDYTYNSANLMETEVLTLGNISWLIDPIYNALGQVDSVTYPSGKSVSYAPNALGQATQVGDYATGATYYPNGQLEGYTYGNGLTFSQTLDAQQRPEYQTVTRSGTNLLNHLYQYDANHNIETIGDLVVPAKNISLTYDGLDRLDTAAGFWGTGSFEYDSLGNIEKKTLGNQSLTYAYNTSNRLTGITGGVSRSFGYDTRGNITSNGVRAFNFNLANQLITSGANSYQYDGYNRRVKKVSNGKTQLSLYNAAGQLLMTDGDNGPTEYFYLGNKLVAKESQVVTSEDTPGYTGHLEDDDLQLTYMQQRYYDPVIGRFYSNDPVGFTPSNPMMFNRYAYANNNPYKYTDPDGKEPLGNLLAQSFGYKNVSHANKQAPKDVAAGMQAAKGAVREGAGDLSDVSTLGAVGAGLLGQPEIAVPLALVAGISGFVEAALSETPAKDLLVESVATVTGAKSVGTVAKIASGLAGESKQIQGAIKAADEAGQHGVSEVIKEDLNEKN